MTRGGGVGGGGGGGNDVLIFFLFPIFIILSPKIKQFIYGNRK